MESQSETGRTKNTGALERRTFSSASLARFFTSTFRFLASLKLAVVVMIGLTLAMIAATFIEAETDTATAQYYIYRAIWFYGLLFLLGVNIFVVAVSRWPWRRHHAAFLLAHAGILLLLAGSWVTYQYGIDGMMRIEENQQSGIVEVNEPQLVFSEGDRVRTVPVRWVPPGTPWRPLNIKDYALRVEEFLTHAEADYEMIAAEAAERSAPAVHVLVQGGFMRIRQEYWLWAGDPSWSVIQAGPALFTIGAGDTFADLSKSRLPLSPMGPGVRLDLRVDAQGRGFFKARNSEGKEVAGSFEKGQVLQPGWKGGVTVTVLEVIPRATSQVSYKPSKIQYGNQAPPSAIRISAGDKHEASMWLGLGDRATLTLQERQVTVAYLPKRYQLPYSLQLNRFQIDYYKGTRNPSSFASDVTVLDPSHEQVALREFPIRISMNEPLHHRDLTFYQSSYEQGEPRPTVSILSVNRDPGRPTKYAGSILLVAGVILLFAEKLKKSRKVRARPDLAKSTSMLQQEQG